MLCHASSVMPDPLLHTIDHTSEASGCSGALWLDCGNSMLVDLLAHLTHRLQSVLNAAARLIYCLRTHDHITDALISLHWLRVLQ